MPSAARLVTPKEPGLPDVIAGEVLAAAVVILASFEPFWQFRPGTHRRMETYRVFFIVHPRVAAHVVAGARDAVQAVADHAGIGTAPPAYRPPPTQDIDWEPALP